ncbi:MAG: TolC family protein [Deltaproteobacteria bacterium]|nr:TolC family protein [Deltaproteobacteria bacterium]
MNRILLGLLFVALTYTPAVFAGDATPLPARGPKTYTLTDCIHQALQVSPEVRELGLDREIAKSRLDQAKASRYPTIETVTLTGPTSQARGDQVNSTYQSNEIHGLTPFIMFDMKVVQPLYTFGKLSKTIEAAEHGITYEESRIIQKKTDVALEIKKYYWALLAARESTRLIDEIQSYLDSALKRARRLLAGNSPSVTEMDLYKLESYNSVITKYREEAIKYETVTKVALTRFMDIKNPESFDIADKTLEPVQFDPAEIQRYIDESKKQRPEYDQIKNGLIAKEALYEAEKADYYPTIFAAGMASYAGAPDRDTVRNPWIYDRFNHEEAGVALGMKWNFDFGITKAKVGQARAEYLKVNQKKDYADMGIPVQVEQAYYDIVEARRIIDSTSKGYKTARKWLVGSVANYDMGVGEMKDASDSIVVYAQLKQEYLKAILNFNLGVSNLYHACGRDVLEVKGAE